MQKSEVLYNLVFGMLFDFAVNIEVFMDVYSSL